MWKEAKKYDFFLTELANLLGIFSSKTTPNSRMINQTEITQITGKYDTALKLAPLICGQCQLYIKGCTGLQPDVTANRNHNEYHTAIATCTNIPWPSQNAKWVIKYSPEAGRWVKVPAIGGDSEKAGLNKNMNLGTSLCQTTSPKNEQRF